MSRPEWNIYGNPSAPSEQKLQKAIIDYLTLKGWFVWKNNNAGVYNPKTGGNIPAQTKGVADLTAIKGGRVIFIEVKSWNGIQSEFQKEFEAKLKAHGGEYFVVRSIEEVEEIEDQFGAVRL